MKKKKKQIYACTQWWWWYGSFDLKRLTKTENEMIETNCDVWMNDDESLMMFVLISIHNCNSAFNCSLRKQWLGEI